MTETTETDDDVILTVAEAAAEVGVEASTLHTWHKRGYLDYAGKRGRFKLVKLSEVFAAEAARKREHRRH